jgi:hypothetical protein
LAVVIKGCIGGVAMEWGTFNRVPDQQVTATGPVEVLFIVQAIGAFGRAGQPKQFARLHDAEQAIPRLSARVMRLI